MRSGSRSLLVCGRCGRHMVGTWRPSGGRSLCSAHYPRHEHWHCEGRSVTAATIEAGVWDYVKGLLADPAVLQARYEAGRGDPAIEPREEQERQRIERKLQAHRRQVRRLIDAYQAEAIELDELQERRQQLDAQGRFLRERLSELERQRQEREQEVRLLQGVEAFCSSIRTALEEPSWEVKRQVLELVVDQIVVEDAEVIIRHIIPAGPVRLQPRRYDVIKQYNAISLRITWVSPVSFQPSAETVLADFFGGDLEQDTHLTRPSVGILLLSQVALNEVLEVQVGPFCSHLYHATTNRDGPLPMGGVHDT